MGFRPFSWLENLHKWNAPDILNIGQLEILTALVRKPVYAIWCNTVCPVWIYKSSREDILYIVWVFYFRPTLHSTFDSFCWLDIVMAKSTPWTLEQQKSSCKRNTEATMASQRNAWDDVSYKSEGAVALPSALLFLKFSWNVQCLLSDWPLPPADWN